MALKALLKPEQHTALDKALQALYKPNNGVFVLDVESVDGWGLEPVDDLKSALSTEKENAKKYFADLQKFKDIDPAKAREAMAKLAELGDATDDKKLQAKIDAALKPHLEKHASELKAATDRGGVLTSALQKALIDTEGLRALGAHGGHKVLLDEIRRRTRMDEVEPGVFKVRVLGDDGKTPRLSKKSGVHDPMELDEFVGTIMKGDKEYKELFRGDGKTGPGGGGNDRPAGGGGGGAYTISRKESGNYQRFKAAQEAAKAAGAELQVVDDE